MARKDPRPDRFIIDLDEVAAGLKGAGFLDILHISMPSSTSLRASLPSGFVRLVSQRQRVMVVTPQSIAAVVGPCFFLNALRLMVFFFILSFPCGV